MQELIQQLTAKAGLSADQATSAIDVIKGFVKEKFPMLAGAVDQMLGADKPEATTTAAAITPTAVNETAAATAAPDEKKEDSSMLDKISDVIPGQVGEKIEDFAKGIGDKLGGLFGK